MDVGFVGLGNMGFPMASRLLDAGHRVTVFDANPEAVMKAVSRGAIAAESAKEVADKVENVFLSLPTPAIVREVCLGEQGAANGAAVKRVVDLSTTGTKVAQEINAALREKGILLVDSPVSGGVAGAVRGTLAVMVSCPRDDFAVVRPVLEVLGRPFFVGEAPGQGQTMKLVNNYLSSVALAATSEAMAVGTKAGLDPSIMVDVVNAGSGRNSASQDKFPKSVLPGTFDAGFTSGLMLKDLSLFMEEASAQQVPMTVGDAVLDVWKKTVETQGAGSDFTEIAKHVEDKAGVKIRAKKP
ncbi:oxidoreductase [Hyaloraphidium curvatum]|nr:oxidoreductase [Hyaloraphidium curvatum]